MTPADVCLLADIGGTNARFALMKDGVISDFRSLPTTGFSGIGPAMEAYLGPLPGRPAIRQALIAAAGPVAGNRCAMTNSSWIVDGNQIGHDFGIGRVAIHNDLEAVAWAIPVLGAGDGTMLGDGVAVPDAPRVIIAPGTGLGVAAWLGGGRALSSEGGHASFAPESETEDELLATLREKHGHVSIERLLSGPGLVEIYRVLVSGYGEGAKFSTAAQITAAALEGTCDFCYQTLDHFCAMLGSLAGNLALTFNGRGGVYIAGGIAPRILPFLSASDFRERFAAKGRLTEWLTTIPTHVITRPDATLLGLRERLLQENPA